MSANGCLLVVLDAELALMHVRLSHCRRKADLQADRKGERQITADRVVEWLEHRLTQLVQARAEAAALPDAHTRLVQG